MPGFWTHLNHPYQLNKLAKLSFFAILIVLFSRPGEDGG